MTGAALAQEAVTSAFDGFSGRGEQPVNIEADRLDVQELQQTAIFSGNVVVVQGTSTLRTKQLTIFYEKDGGGDQKTAPAAPAASKDDVVTGRQIRKLEADGSVMVTSNDQKAVGDRGVFDMKSNTAVLIGNVIVTQGTNILKGDKLFVDLTTQKSRVESASNGGRVQGVFGSSRPGAKPAPGAPQAPAPAPSSAPLKITPPATQ
jgi:lipopolysaccharide export system protein LptA